MTACPSNFQQWIAEHRCQPNPPVGNQQVFKDNQDFLIMMVGGLKARRVYHLDASGKLVVQPDDAKRSCSVCGTHMEAPAPVLD